MWRPQDYSIDCDSPGHRSYKLFASALLLVFPIGTPLVTALLLWRSRDCINPPNANSEADAITTRMADPEIAPLRQLFSPYKPRWFFFEVIDMYRRLLMSGALVFISAKRRRAVIVVLCAARAVLLGRSGGRRRSCSADLLAGPAGQAGRAAAAPERRRNGGARPQGPSN